jgi:hypothetical protein
MKTRNLTLISALIVMLSAAIPAFAMDGMSGHGSGNDKAKQEAPEHGASDKGASGHGASGHGAMEEKASMGFTHQEKLEGVQAEFQIMSLASMNMKDPGGATHHVMLKLMDSATHEQIKQAEGKIKIIGPDKKEQTSDLKDYSGILAANINFDAPGKYGVICLFKAQGQKHLIKFWYPHQS